MLVEVLIVLLVLSVLVGIAVPIYMSTQSTATLRACQANLRTIDGAITTYHAREPEASYPDAVGDLVSSGFLKVAPLCPQNHSGYLINSSHWASCVEGHTYP
jgi:type IV pilus assembly protein PilA